MDDFAPQTWVKNFDDDLWAIQTPMLMLDEDCDVP